MSVDTARLRELLAKATPGPWMIAEGSASFEPIIEAPAAGDRGIATIPFGYSHESGAWSEYSGNDMESDFALIAEAITALPALLDRLDAAERVCEAVEQNGPNFLALPAYIKAHTDVTLVMLESFLATWQNSKRK